MQNRIIIFLVILSVSIVAPFSLFSQQQLGHKATLNSDGTVTVSDVLVPLDASDATTFEPISGYPFGRPANPSFKNFRGASFGDLDEDGRDEILFGAYSTLYAVSGEGEILWEKSVSGTITHPPAIADMNGDGHLEIALNTGGVPNAGRVYLMDRFGEDLPNWPQNFSDHWIFNAPTVVDLDGDGNMEVISCERGTSTSGFLHIMKMDGEPFNSNWPLELPGNLAFTPSVGDVNNDGSLDIVMAISSGSLYAINQDGTFLDGFPVTESDRSFSYQSPILVDLDGDNTLEIIGARHGDVSDYYVVKSDGSYMAGWPLLIPTGWRYSPPTVVDSDGDGSYEIYVGHPNNGSDPLDVMFGLNPDASAISGFPINKMGGCEGVVSIGDVNGDDVLEVVFTSNTTDAAGFGYIHAYALDGSGEVDGFPLRPKGFTFLNSAILNDIDGDNMLDVSCISYTQFTGTDSIFLTSYNMGVAYDESKILANGYKGDPTHQGLVTEMNTPPVENLVYDPAPGDILHVTVVWDAPSSANPDSYNIYIDGELEGNTTETIFGFDHETIGTYDYCVTALYVGVESEEVCLSITLVIPIVAPFNFSIDSENWNSAGDIFDANVSWDHPYFQFPEISYTIYNETGVVVGTCSNTLQYTITDAEPNSCYYATATYPSEETAASNSDCTTATESIEKETITLFPNPVRGKLSLTSKNPVSCVAIYTFTGQLLFSQNVENVKRVMINTTLFATGSYLLQVEANGSVITKKIVIIN